jgi:hypothetical protein
VRWALRAIPDRCRTHAKDWASRAFRRSGDGSALWGKVPGDDGRECRLTQLPARWRWSCAARRMSEDGFRSWSSVSLLLVSNRCLVLLCTSQESGQQQRCSKHGKRRRRRFQTEVCRCTSSTHLDRSHFPIHWPPQLRSN